MTEEQRHQQGLAKLQQIAGERASYPLDDWNRVAPDMQHYIVDFIAGDILSRPGLDSKTRQLVTVAMLCALGHAPDEFKMHLGGALRLGWTQQQLVEVLLQAAVFSGFPSSLNALKWAIEVFDQNPSAVAASAASVLIEKCQAADAAMDADAFVALLTPDVVFRMGSQPELKGRASVREAVAALFGKLRAIQHRTIYIWEDGPNACLRAEVNFGRKDGREFVLPYANSLTIAPEGLISDYRIHIDISPMLSA